MKLHTVLFTICIAIFILFGMSVLTHAQNISTDPERWDLRMIEEEPIWFNLFANYYFAEKGKYWNDTKVKLKTIINEYPESRWIDDAELMLAGGKASFEGDIQGAIDILEDIIEKYPASQTVVTYWAPDSGCRFDMDWMYSVAFIMGGKAFDRYGTINKYDRALLYYFEHLEKYPRFTKDVAKFIIALMLSQQGDMVGAITELESLIAINPDLSSLNDYRLKPVDFSCD